MADVLLFARVQWRRHWRGLAALGLLVALVGGVVLVAATGARRAPGAFERLRQATDASDLRWIALPYRPTAETLATIEQTDGVAAVAVQTEVLVRPVGRADLYPDYNLYPVVLGWDDDAPLNSPVVMEGRSPVASAASEVALSATLAESLGVGVGDGFALEGMTQEQLELARTGVFPEVFEGPKLDVTVVGIVRSPLEFGQFRAAVYLTPAFLDRFEPDTATYPWVEVRLDRSQAGAETRVRSVLVDLSIAAGSPTDVASEALPSLFGATDVTDDGLAAIARSLWIVAAVAAVGGLLAIAQFALRLSRSVMVDRDALAAIGWTRNRCGLGVAWCVGPAMAAGSLLALVAAAVASPLALVGLAARVDPSPDAFVVDPAVFLVGACAMVAALGIVVLVAARLGPRERAAVTGRTPVPLPIGRPLAPCLGVRQALGVSPGEARAAGRNALLLGTIAVAGIVAALTVSASIDLLQRDPTLLGGDEGRGTSGEGLDATESALAVLGTDPRVDMLLRYAVIFSIHAVQEPGTELAVLSGEVLRGESEQRMVAGREPTQSDEIALGPAVLERLDLEIGDEIILETGERSASYRIVGSALVPEGDFHFDEGAVMSFAASDRLIDSTADDPDLIHGISFSWKAGVDTVGADADLDEQGIQLFYSQDAVLPGSVANLAEVESIPRWIALFLGVIAMTSLGHGLVMTVRSHRDEVEVLQALGLRPRSVAGIVSTHALAAALITVVLGVPLGLVVGRQLWTRIAEQAHVVVETVAPWPEIGLLTGIGLVGAAVLAAVSIGQTLVSDRHRKLRRE